MKTINFIKTALIIIFCLLQIHTTFAQSKQKPNIVIIITDQQFADAMSCVAGNEYLSTPNMDLLAEKGVRFTKAYSPNPLCLPMRTSMVTGKFPHETGVLTNDDKKMDASKQVFLGKIFQDAGYETGYFGKWHIALNDEQKDIHGFQEMNTKSNLDAEPAAEFIKKKHNKPFLAVASFLSPHEICQWARFQELPGGPIGELPPLEELPPLKENFNPPANETDIMTYMRESYQAHRLFPVGDYTDADWRRLAWGYYRLIERADEFVGKVVNAVKESGQEENTVVVFLADHGDCCGSHRWNQKTVFYDESVRVPLIIAWGDKTKRGTSDFLVNTGTDMIPTLCDFAGIKIPGELPGTSLFAATTGTSSEPKREYVISENHLVQNEPVNGEFYQPQGRMVRSTNFKYCIYSEGKERESLIDMKFDELEMVNQAKNPVYKEVLQQHRAYLKEHATNSNDAMAIEMLNELN
jgi:arylsulfatase A-like enzyme